MFCKIYIYIYCIDTDTDNDICIPLAFDKSKFVKQYYLQLDKMHLEKLYIFIEKIIFGIYNK